MMQPRRPNANATVKQIQMQLLDTDGHTEVGWLSLIHPNDSTQGPSASKRLSPSTSKALWVLSPKALC
jgi:hypothetical protein